MGEAPTGGAFVELDVFRLNRDELVLLGMKEAHDHWIDELRGQATRGDLHPVVKMILGQVADRMESRRDDLAVILTKAAMRNKSGKLEKVRGAS